MNKHIDQIVSDMKQKQMDYLLITDPYAIDYLIDYLNFPHERVYVMALSAKGNHQLFFNKLFYVDKKIDIPITWFNDSDDALGLIADYLKDASIIGVDKNMPARWLIPLMNQVKANYVLGSELVDHERSIKDEKEKNCMRIASKINDQVMAEVFEVLKENKSELEMSQLLIDIYKKYGGESYSFEPIFGYGKNGADPHHMVDETKLKPGDSIIVDMGCFKDKYASDMTRTFFYKEVSEKQKEVYELVLKANQEAIKAIKPGIHLSEIDKIARDIITEGGYGKEFNHRLGHFIGRECHEAGEVSPSSKIIAEVGMCFSIEPGVYIPGEFGVRIEDLVCVTENGCEVLNAYPKELKIIE